MGLLELFFVGVGLSMDAFAVSVCKGLGMKQINWLHALVIALFFGVFQAFMPLVGWALGTQFEQFITPVDHWIAFGLLVFIGGKMLWDAFRGDDGGCCADTAESAAEAAGAAGSTTEAAAAGEATAANEAAAAGGFSPSAVAAPGASASLDVRELVMLAIATSIDALAVGITFAFLGVNVWLAVVLIGVTTFVLSFAGVALGNQFGARFEKPATLVGGAVLVLIGLKILLEHLGVLVL